jgi:hypothetical protein
LWANKSSHTGPLSSILSTHFSPFYFCNTLDLVIEAIRSCCKGRNSKKIRTQLNYFIKHQRHMAYAHIATLNLPIGSGAMESAIRRVVNLRLKGPSVFWCKPNAEAILLLRSFYKTGRWQQLKSWAFSPVYVYSR